ncbi:MAG: ComEC/Rec2 family competence protein [Sphaerochaetaceae bacterium]
MKAVSFFMFLVLAFGLLFPSVIPGVLYLGLGVFFLSAVLLAAFPFSRGTQAEAVAAVLLAGLLLLLFRVVWNGYQVSLPFAPEQVRSISGMLVADSSESQIGSQVMTIRLQRAWASDGSSGSASGVITAIGGENAIVPCASAVRVNGVMKNGDNGLFFSCRSWMVSRPNRAFQQIRAWILDWTLERLETDDESSSLFVMLLLGRSTESGARIRQKAKDAGCLHVLALSGLHLGFFSSIAGAAMAFSKRKWKKRILALALSVVFVAVIGPKSSLVRALLFMTVSFSFPALPGVVSLCLAALVQMMAFPDTMNTIGVQFSYLATSGVVFLGPMISRMLEHFMSRKFADMIGSGIGAVAMSAALGLQLEGVWSPLAIVLTQPASSAVFLMMGIGFLRLAFPKWGLLRMLGNWIFSYLDWLFGFSLSLSGAWLGVLLVPVLTAWVFIKYSQRRLKGEIKRNELELQLRFTCRDKGRS